jgi:hypothetical protein
MAARQFCCFGILACIAAVTPPDSASAFTTRITIAPPSFATAAAAWSEGHRQTVIASKKYLQSTTNNVDGFLMMDNPPSSSPLSNYSRRSIFSTSLLLASITTILTSSSPLLAFAAAETTNTDSLIADLNTSLERISTIPPLLEAAQWDKVRTILKTPPVVDLWNLGDSKNTLAKIALSTGNMEIMEYKDELSISLQMTDQYSYDNNFIYYQPGNGKVKTKEPLDMANKAIVQLKEAVEFVKSNI